MEDPQMLLIEFAEWSEPKRYNFIIELIRELTDKQKRELAEYLTFDLI